MTIGTVDRLEAALAELTREDIAALAPARRRRLQGSLSAWECLCDDILHPGQPKADPCVRAMWREVQTPPAAKSGVPAE